MIEFILGMAAGIAVYKLCTIAASGEKKKCILAKEEQAYFGGAFLPEPPHMDVIVEYEDNSPVCRELRISLSQSDWCKFEKQPFFLQLVEWVRRLENCNIPHSIDHLGGRQG